MTPWRDLPARTRLYVTLARRFAPVSLYELSCDVGDGWQEALGQAMRYEFAQVIPVPNSSEAFVSLTPKGREYADRFWRDRLREQRESIIAHRRAASGIRPDMPQDQLPHHRRVA